MAIDLIGSVAATQNLATQPAALGQDDFLKILLTQLTYQDPMKPLDNQQFIAQMAQFSALEQSRQLNEKIDSLLSSQAATQAFGLLQKDIAYRQTDGVGGQNKQGRVIGVSIENGTTTLRVNPLDQNGNPISATVEEGIRLSSIVSINVPKVAP